MITARLLCLFTGVFATAVSCQPTPQKPKFTRAVLVHGIFEDGTAFNSLKRRLESHGIQCLVPKLRPADGRGGLDKLAENLAADIEREFGSDEKFALVAFSMGGLVSRYYLQNLGGAERCEMFITISSPHNGTKAAYSYFSKGAMQMRPGSPFLQELRETEGSLDGIPVISYRTPMDLMILPPASSVWDRAENHSFRILLHPLMLHSNSVLDDIERRFLYEEDALPDGNN